MSDQPGDDVPVRPKRDPTLLRRIEQLCEEFCGEKPLVVECSVDDTVSLLVFDVPISREDVSS